MPLPRLSNALLGVIAAVAGCATSQQPGSAQQTRYLAKGDRCKQVAELAGTAAVLAAKMRSGASEGAEPEHIVSYAITEEAGKLGWSPDETRAFAREICAAPPLEDVRWEILRANLYHQVACKLATEGKPVRPYSTLTKRLQSCLLSSDEGMQRTCAEAEIR